MSAAIPHSSAKTVAGGLRQACLEEGAMAARQGRREPATGASVPPALSRTGSQRSSKSLISRRAVSGEQRASFAYFILGRSQLSLEAIQQAVDDRAWRCRATSERNERKVLFVVTMLGLHRPKWFG